MVIIFKGFGNHSNRLFQAIHIEAFCLENKIRFYNPSFSGMAGYYGIKSNFYDRFLSLFSRFLNKIKIIRPLYFDESELYNDLFLKKKLAFYQGWLFRAEALTKKHHDYFIHKYSLLPKYYLGNNLYNTVLKINRDEFIIVGVHIRKGDYKYWQEGKYYFTDEVYQKYMNNLSRELEKLSNKKTVFIIFSNEKTNSFTGETILISENEWYIDQFIMSKCNYLIGPPSTFTLWASYIGKVKYFHIKDADGVIKLDDFVIQES